MDKNGWIKTSDELPKQCDSLVTIMDDGGYTYRALFRLKHWYAYVDNMTRTRIPLDRIVKWRD